MDREFLDFYDTELKLLKEQAREFAEEYPGVGGRLGDLIGDRPDPMIVGLLEGAAFLAARVQLKLKHEFSEFTSNLLEQLVPNYLAPTPSALLAKILPPYSDPALREGNRVARGSYLDATYRERDRRIACKYRLSSDITLWPFDIVGAEYIAAPGPLQALGLSAGPEAVAGLRLSLTNRTAARLEEEMSDADAQKQPGTWFAGCRTTELPFYILGSEDDAIALYEQIFAHRIGVYFRHLDEFGDPVIVPAPENCIEQIGFDEDEALLPNDKRIFRGFDLLREYFLFPSKFLGFRLRQLAAVLPRIKTKSADLIIVFNEANPRLSAAVQPSMFALYTAPAINLFEKTTDRVAVRPGQHEYQIVPDRSRNLDFEPHRVLEAYAHYKGGQERVPVYPLYSAPPDATAARTGPFYMLRRVPRRRIEEERKYGVSSDYTGTDLFISITDPGGVGDAPEVAELSLRALCSNRHLTEHLPVGESGADFRLLDDVTLDVVCVAGPTRPRGPVVGQLRGKGEPSQTGTVTWRLINMLSLNQLGLVQRGAGQNGQSLREMLSLFADLTDSAMERRIRGVRSVDSRPIVRRIKDKTGIGAARGVEITVTLDDKAFEGSGVFLLGVILDWFFAEYVALNHFTQTVIRTIERGEIIRWPPRSGSRRML